MKVPLLVIVVEVFGGSNFLWNTATSTATRTAFGHRTAQYRMILASSFLAPTHMGHIFLKAILISIFLNAYFV